MKVGVWGRKPLIDNLQSLVRCGESTWILACSEKGHTSKNLRDPSQFGHCLLSWLPCLQSPPFTLPSRPQYIQHCCSPIKFSFPKCACFFTYQCLISSFFLCLDFLSLILWVNTYLPGFILSHPESLLWPSLYINSLPPFILFLTIMDRNRKWTLAVRPSKCLYTPDTWRWKWVTKMEATDRETILASMVEVFGTGDSTASV